MTDREEFWSQASRFTPTMLVEKDGLRFFVSTTDRNVGRWVFLKGYYSKSQLDLVGKVLAGLGLLDRAQDQTVVNVGANIGTVAVPLVKQFGFAHGVACEPEPANFDLLRLNILANGLEDRIEAVRAAVGTSEREVPFGVFEGKSGTHMVLRDGRLRSKFADQQGRRILTVPGATLDGLLAERRVDPGRVGLVWVDTQGHEAHVLRGASQLLDRPVPMLIEFHPGMLGDTLPDLEELVMERFTHVLDVRRLNEGDDPRPEPVESMPQLADDYRERRHGAFTDLLLLNL
ncbi:MAG: FkbM family methyltransferase [Actinomycetota bacterium]|nr:FkbM family methyltransferase [Actinomycetota bacterium]